MSPDFSEARDALGILYLTEGDYDQALNQFEWAVAGSPDVALFQYHLAVAHILKGSIGFAAPALNRALELDPENLDIKRTLLDVYMMLGRWDRAERLHVELVQAKYADETLAFAEGLIAFAKEELDRAKLKFQQTSSDFSQDPAPPTALGLLFETQGFLDDAETAYKTALERAPEDPYVNLVAADFYHKSGRYSQADRLLRRTLATSARGVGLSEKDKAEVYFQIADVNYQTGSYKNSELYRRRAVRLLPALEDSQIGIDAAAHFALGTVEYERGNIDTAIHEFKLAVKGNPKFTLAWAKLAESLLLKAGLSPLNERLALLRNARVSAQKAQELAPRSALGYYLEGKVLVASADLQEGAFRGGALREAVFAFQQARNASDPPNDIGIFQAMILSDLASHVEAADALAHAAKQNTGSYEIAFLRSAEYIKAEKYPEARIAVSEAYLIDAEQDDLGPLMSLILFKLGDADNAVKAMNWEPGKGQLPGVLTQEEIREQVRVLTRKAAEATAP